MPAKIAFADADLAPSATLLDEIESNTADNAADQEATRPVSLVGGHFIGAAPDGSAPTAIRHRNPPRGKRERCNPPTSDRGKTRTLLRPHPHLQQWLQMHRRAEASEPNGRVASARSQQSGALSNDVSDALMVNSALASAPPPGEDDLSTPQSGTTLIAAAPDLAIAREPSPSIASLFGGVTPGARAAVGTPRSSARQVSRPDRRNSIPARLARAAAPCGREWVISR